MNLTYFRKLIHYCPIVALLFLFSCNKGTTYSDTAPVVDTEFVIADTVNTEIAPDSIDSKPQWGDMTFATAEEALDYMNMSGHSSAYNSGIFPIMAKENLKYLTKLLNSPYSRFIVVDKQTMNVVLFDKYGREEARYGMACAKNYGTKHKKADSRTPEGFFSVEGIYDSTDWLFTDDNGKTSQVKGQFGPRFIRLKIPTTSQIGIHGTCAPWSIGHRTSHGCIRVTNDNIVELVKKVEIGMPVIVSPGVKDDAVNKSEDVTIGYVSIDPQGTPRPSTTWRPTKVAEEKDSTATTVEQPAVDYKVYSVEEDSIH